MTDTPATTENVPNLVLDDVTGEMVSKKLVLRMASENTPICNYAKFNELSNCVQRVEETQKAAREG